MIESHEIKVENVWQRVTPDLQKEVVSFWHSNQLLPPNISADERAREVVLVVRDGVSGNIVGISSASFIQFKQLNNNYFFLFRSIILPDFRFPGLIFKIAVETLDILESFATALNERIPIGVLTFVENPMIIEKMNQAVWPATKMVYIGNDKDGRQIRVYYFKGATV